MKIHNNPRKSTQIYKKTTKIDKQHDFKKSFDLNLFETAIQKMILCVYVYIYMYICIYDPVYSQNS